MPLLTTRLTLAPYLRCLCGFGFWEITCPFFALAEKTRSILPTRQPWALILRSARCRRFPLTLGTRQTLRKDARTERAAVIESVQDGLPVQALDQPVNDDPLVALAIRVTKLP